MTDRPNPYEDAARVAKAARLAVTLIACGVTANTASTMGDDLWRKAMDAAGVSRFPSEETKRIVGDLLRKHDRIKAYSTKEGS